MINIINRQMKSMIKYKYIFIVIIFISIGNLFLYCGATTKETFNVFFASEINIKFQSVEICYMLIMSSFFIWMTYILYTMDIHKSREFIFLRVSTNKWLISTFISIFIFNFILHIVGLIIYIIVSRFLGNYIDFKYILYNFPIVFLIRLAFMYINTMLLGIFLNFSVFIFYTIYLLPLIIKSEILNILNYLYASNYSGYNDILIFSMIAIVVCFNIDKKMLRSFLERV